MDTSLPSAQDPAAGARDYQSKTEQTQATPHKDPLLKVWSMPKGLYGMLASVQNDVVGLRIMYTAFAFFVAGGINALLFRLQLAVPENTFLTPEAYNQFFTMHGSTMMYLFAVPILEGFAIIILPMILGNREMPFPRLGVFSYFTFLFGGVLFYTSFIFNAVPENGWFAYVPLSGPKFSPGLGMDFWLLALGVAEVAAIAAGVEIIIAILRMRAPGMSLSRLPLFGWAMLVTAFAILFAFTTLFVATMLLEMDRKFGTQFFNADAGGSPILWQHLFWIFGHPEVYIQFIPAIGMVSTMLPAFTRRPVVGYPFVAMAIVATGFVSFGLWVHHMFTVGMPQLAMTFFTAASVMIAIPSGVQVFAWITTILRGRPVWKTPFYFLLGFLFNFVLGGITGVMVASVPFDAQVHDSFFVVAHFHYVLIGGVTFPVFAAFYYWLPKYTGKLFDELLGKIHFWLLFIGFNITFFPQHILGIMGMPRRVYTYPAETGWGPLNLLSTAGAFLIAASVAVFLINLIKMYVSGRPAGDNPWRADTLEWATPSPPPPYGFATLPVVRSRSPLWEQERLDAGDDRMAQLSRAMARWPTAWRAAMVTSVLHGEPEEIFRVSGPSIWPFFTAVGAIMIFGSEIWSLRWLAAIGVVIVVVGIIAWNWPSKPPTSEEEEEAFERENNIPVRTTGSQSIVRDGMVLTLLILGIALAVLLFSYFYIRLDNPEWPPPGIPNPSWIFPAISLAIFLAGIIPVYLANQAVFENQQRSLKTSLSAALFLSIVSSALWIYNLVQAGLDISSHAYVSLFYVVSGFFAALLVGTVILSGMVTFWAWEGKYFPKRTAAVQNVGIFWYGIAGYGVVVFLVVYLGPYFF